MSETRDDLREALARAIWDQRYAILQDASWDEALQKAKVIPDGRSADAVCTIRHHADALLAGPLAPILAQVSALQAEVERLQKVEGEREKGAERVPSGPGSHATHEAPSDLRPEGFDPSRMRQRLAKHGPLVLDEQVNPADVEAQCVSAVVLAYDARGNDAIVHLPATFVHWLIQQNERTLAWAKDEQVKRHRAEEQRTDLRSRLAALQFSREKVWPPKNQWKELDEHPYIGLWHVRHTIPAARDTGYMFGKNFATAAEALTFCQDMREQDWATRLLTHVEGDRWLMHPDPSQYYFVPGSTPAPCDRSGEADETRRGSAEGESTVTGAARQAPSDNPLTETTEGSEHA